MPTPSKNRDSWKYMSSDEKKALVAILVSVVVFATVLIAAVDVEGPSSRGNFGAAMLSVLFNFEDENTHINSYEFLWLARAVLVAVVLCVVWSVRSRKARLAERDDSLEQ